MRVLHYSHDTSDSGHIRKTMAVAEQVALNFPQATQLLVTGSPQPRNTKLPHKLDFIKLPSLNKFSQGEDHAPSHQNIIKALREKIILNAIKHFDPDVVFVDNASAEVQGEMLRSLQYLKHERPETEIVMGTSPGEDNRVNTQEALCRSNAVFSSYVLSPAA